MHMYTCFRTEAINTHHAGKESERERERERKTTKLWSLRQQLQAKPHTPNHGSMHSPQSVPGQLGDFQNTKEMLGPRVRLVPACGCLRRGDFGLLPDLRSLRLRRRIWSRRTACRSCWRAHHSWLCCALDLRLRTGRFTKVAGLGLQELLKGRAQLNHCMAASLYEAVTTRQPRSQAFGLTGALPDLLV